MAAFQTPKMARKAFNQSQTNDDGDLITAPVIRVVRPLPRRAQGAPSQSQWHCGTDNMLATQPLAGPSRLANALATPFLGTPTHYKDIYQSRNPQDQCLMSSKRTWLPSPSMPPTQLEFARPESPTESPPKKRLRIEISDIISKGKQKGVEFPLHHVSNSHMPPAAHERRAFALHHFDHHANVQSDECFSQTQLVAANPRSGHATKEIRISRNHIAKLSDRDNEGGIEELTGFRDCGAARRKEGPLSGQSRQGSKEKRPVTSSSDSTVRLGPIPAVAEDFEPSDLVSNSGLSASDPQLEERGLDVLQEHRCILPPHVHPSSPISPLPLYGFKALLKRRIYFVPVDEIPGGNGTSSLEVVRSGSVPDGGGFGFPEGSLWVLKAFKAWREDVDSTMRRNALTQLNRESAAYTRIAETMGGGDVGFEFIMNIEAVLIINFKPCLVLPLMWKDLAHLIKESNGKLSRRDSRRILAQTVIGLATLHSIGIIHSDIKPANIFIDARGNVKIGDFGLSHVTESIESLSVSGRYSALRQGTVGYMAPEKIDSIGYSYPVDYWSIGWVLYRLVSEKKRLMNALVDDGALMHWAVNYRRLDDRKKFFESERFDDHTLDLICGLLDPNPQTRMGVKEMLIHDFFLTEDGSSEFLGMENALSRAAYPISEKWDKPARDRSNVRLRYTSQPNDDSSYRWINPYGAYVAGSKLHDCLC